MKRLLTFAFLLLFIASCGVSNKFTKRKYLDLKHKTAKKKADAELLDTDETQTFDGEVQPEPTAEVNNALENEPDENSADLDAEDNTDKDKVSKNKIKKLYKRTIEPVFDKGIFESEKKNDKRVNEGDEEVEQEMNIAALAAFIALIAGLVFFPALIAALILGYYGMREIRAEPERYNNMWMAKVAFIVSLVILILVFLFVLFLITVFLLAF